MTDLSDFNYHMVGLYSSRAFLVAGRIYDLAPDRWEQLACIWMARHGFFELKDDRYLTETSIRFKSVDALVAEANPEMTPTAQHLYDQWLGIKAKLAKQRSTDPIIIKPPAPTPTPLPIPDPIPETQEPKPEPKKNPSPSLVKFGVWFGILSSIAGVVAWFVPGAKPWVAVIVPAIKAILSALGV